MRIIPIAIPTPFYVGDVNVYLIKEDPITLIDVGPKTTAASLALEAGAWKRHIEPRFGKVPVVITVTSHALAPCRDSATQPT